MSGDNIGPAGGIALGMRHVLEDAADDDWILTLDDDDPPRTPEMIETLEQFADELATSRPAGRRRRAVRRPLRRVSRTLPHGRATPSWSARCRSSWVGGNQFPCYSVTAVRTVGVFDERFFINFEELDYGLRMHDHGFGIYAHGDVWRRERHRVGREHIDLAPDRHLGDPGWRRYYSLRNLVFLMRQRGHRLVALRVSLLNLAKPLYNVPRSPRLAWPHLRLNARAVADAYRGRMGRTVEPAPKAKADARRT